jgi:hypothetical protein
LKFSRHLIPLFTLGSAEFYPFHVAKYIREKVRLQVELSPFRFSGQYAGLIATEWSSLWEKYYLPPRSIAHDGLIVDIGAGEGETAIFYMKHGYTNFRLVEVEPASLPFLSFNVEILRRHGCRVDVKYRSAKNEDMVSASFIKMDCEGCEMGLIADYPKDVPSVIEVHSNDAASKYAMLGFRHVKKVAQGVYLMRNF